MKKISISFFFFIICLCILSFGIINAFAAEEIASGSLGYLNWILDDSGLLTISGYARMGVVKWSENEAWHAYKDDIESVVIEEGVPNIGAYAFYNCSFLKNVTIPQTVTEIGLDSFSGCTSLEEISIPSSITKIGGSVFANCSNLKSLYIPDSVTNLGNSICFLCFRYARHIRTHIHLIIR